MLHAWSVCHKASSVFLTQARPVMIKHLSSVAPLFEIDNFSTKSLVKLVTFCEMLNVRSMSGGMAKLKPGLLYMPHVDVMAKVYVPTTALRHPPYFHV